MIKGTKYVGLIILFSTIGILAFYQSVRTSADSPKVLTSAEQAAADYRRRTINKIVNLEFEREKVDQKIKDIKDEIMGYPDSIFGDDDPLIQILHRHLQIEEDKRTEIIKKENDLSNECAFFSINPRS